MFYFISNKYYQGNTYIERYSCCDRTTIAELALGQFSTEGARNWWEILFVYIKFGISLHAASFRKNCTVRTTAHRRDFAIFISVTILSTVTFEIQFLHFDMYPEQQQPQ